MLRREITVSCSHRDRLVPGCFLDLLDRGSGLRDDASLMTLEDARYLLDESNAAGSKVHFKQLGTALAIQRGVDSTRGKGEHRAKGGNPDQWPEDLNIREWPAFPGRVSQSRRSSTGPTTLVNGSISTCCRTEVTARLLAISCCPQRIADFSHSIGFATRFIRVALAESLFGSASAIFNVASDSDCSSAFAELNRSLAYQFAREETELFSSPASIDSIDSELLRGRLPKKIAGQLAFATRPQYQQGNSKIGIGIAAGTILDENTPAVLQEFPPSRSDGVVCSTPRTSFSMANEPSLQQPLERGIVAPGESPADF